MAVTPCQSCKWWDEFCGADEEPIDTPLADMLVLETEGRFNEILRVLLEV